ncbi:DUF4400 domain-containing protein [Vibrio crassostreae]|uniref:DUF4400 domain-containing protein n=1 Tax=Vibrio crassostreae TaxID=246167 RepID=UPI001045EDB8|nr:DUF4400 domain-containing protein [Vibrio crassostreae]TCU01442.1 uncharacterized protein DUF4400 [Vibrio crassostreae]CAK2246018.1 DUF4400 domain-containing protein [Vibrio crassostreae]CAK2969189.1 DUF4400 domain-containing protein [Vibrio crassostreae]CAK3003454.1 DUF4400 domain-containing protein [Vibrio crassostreae]CAK3712310.1 DUF4400 domain-containing protein [Vibrio crassostreae]
MAHDTQSFIDEGNKALLGEGVTILNPWVRLGFMIWFFSLLYCWFGMSAEQFRTDVINEVSIVQSAMTEEQSEIVFDRVNNLYQTTMVNTGISGVIDRFYITPEKSNGSGVFIAGISERLVDNTKMWWYRSILRVNVLLEWLLLGAVLIFAFMSDSYYEYRKRIYAFNQHNVKLAAMAFRMIFIVLFSLWIFLVVPIIDGGFWRYLPLFFIGLCIILTTTIMREFQRF